MAASARASTSAALSSGRGGRSPAEAPRDQPSSKRPNAPASRRPPLPERRLWLGVGLGHVPQKHDEFVAADTRDHVGGAHFAQQRRRDRFEHRVAGGMAMAIVDRLEFVEVEIDQRRARAVALDVGQRALELALEAAAIERLGQRIDVDPAFSSLMRAREAASSAASRSTSAASRAGCAKRGCAAFGFSAPGSLGMRLARPQRSRRADGAAALPRDLAVFCFTRAPRPANRGRILARGDQRRGAGKRLEIGRDRLPQCA